MIKFPSPKLTFAWKRTVILFLNSTLFANVQAYTVHITNFKQRYAPLPPDKVPQKCDSKLVPQAWSYTREESREISAVSPIYQHRSKSSMHLGWSMLQGCTRSASPPKKRIITDFPLRIFYSVCFGPLNFFDLAYIVQLLNFIADDPILPMTFPMTATSVRYFGVKHSQLQYRSRIIGACITGLASNRTLTSTWWWEF